MDIYKRKCQLGRPEKKRERIDFDELVDLKARKLGFLFLAVLSVFLFSKMSRPALRPRQPPIQRVLEYFHGDKAAGA
jgi:hypothetical protein